MTRRIQRGLIWGLIGGVCFILLITPEFLMVLITPLVGLVAAPQRLFVHWQPSLQGVLLLGIALAVLVTGTHSFLAWVFKAKNRKLQDDAKPVRQWRLPWTLCGFGIICCTLVAVVSTVLIAHQTYWLRHSSEPWFVNSTRQHVQRIMMAHDLRSLAEEKQWLMEPLRASLAQTATAYDERALWEDYQPVLVEQPAGKLQAILMVPRRTSEQGNRRVLIIQANATAMWHPLDKLPQLLDSVGISNNNAADHLKPQPVGQ